MPTVPDDAATAQVVPDPAGEAYLEVRTIPDGGTIKVGDQSRNAIVKAADPSGGATAQLVLEAGRHVIIAELAGYHPEKREVVIQRGEHQKIEIAFTKRILARPERGTPTGKLSVRTTPWSDVYLGTKKLGQTPFADLELPAGTHTLTFKNPSRPTSTKTIKITAGKSTKLNFNLP
jgi:serine/threonine-protein kinase